MLAEMFTVEVTAVFGMVVATVISVARGYYKLVATTKELEDAKSEIAHLRESLPQMDARLKVLEAISSNTHEMGNAVNELQKLQVKLDTLLETALRRLELLERVFMKDNI